MSSGADQTDFLIFFRSRFPTVSAPTVSGIDRTGVPNYTRDGRDFGQDRRDVENYRIATIGHGVHGHYPELGPAGGVCVVGGRGAEVVDGG